MAAAVARGCGAPQGRAARFPLVFLFLFSLFLFLKKRKNKKEKSGANAMVAAVARGCGARQERAARFPLVFLFVKKTVLFFFVVPFFFFLFFKKKTVLFFFVVLFFKKKRDCRGTRAPRGAVADSDANQSDERCISFVCVFSACDVLCIKKDQLARNWPPKPRRSSTH